ncbi:Gfo/Idh/MocA family protein [Myceligenerans pegani]|uniref:Gfo/Idh/MocA family oxidoreductase n=1 Tax=Myceligenerans pegani TaxID=2776917 RepID=A0ABR9N536_9MICO|nr:Gfo/Idh/MocA family oxidoreductase [Myceligenerans sp. TRM 65318]MBE1878381.1 Gfo/Idh/MocA family oxidoreductase [Myceligenerans sp. TRM 65318]MBE3020652.1 Gfo/Idh/MocA family oxidoreductase [Myceligenerans sp. TRM 65318]
MTGTGRAATAGTTAERRSGVAGVGIIGAGNISDQYLGNLTRFPDVEVRFVADLDEARAAAQATAYGVGASGGVDELLARDDIEVVLNLTVPAVHTDVSRRVLAAGKHVWSEKPLALDRDAAATLLADAEAAGLRVACAPDTVLGNGIQTALRAIARGDIGQPLTATTMFHVPGPDVWHPNPDFFFAPGGGPVLDMGPYYLTTLVHVFGSAARAQAVASTSRTSRTVGSGPRAGETFAVLVPTHHAAIIEFDGGASAQSTFSFQHALPRYGLVEINGTEGTIVLPDPNGFDGDSVLWRHGVDGPTTIPAAGPEYGRGAGVVDLVRSIRDGGTERASGAVAAHVLDIMLSIQEAAHAGRPVEIASAVGPVEPLPEGWDPAEATVG